MWHMKKQRDIPEDETNNPLWQRKREAQARSRELVSTGQRTQESMFLIPPAIAQTVKVKHRA